MNYLRASSPSQLTKIIAKPSSLFLLKKTFTTFPALFSDVSVKSISSVTPNIAVADNKTTVKPNIPSVNLKSLKLSNELYAIFKIHNRPYLVTEGDKVILPFKMKNVEIGDILQLNDVVTIGSRNYKLVDYPIASNLYSLKAVVLEKTKRPMRIREVTKQRNRKVRHAMNKADLTILRITELKIK
ncbi:mitochondrial 54S ribosomal protein bL21m SCDLUD_003670 [Saccharomycodes ludwigii]|uniref:mitochondrial 54S ribosomal protein bL21m n=1 Tax=Saccharomycodes ludwigii TaxID=36035 RepID=UPI001E831586|nr:hypothetical protein SCDLUD_003670 [Saccharomycodes ludwigii]KAH3900672.1 hypothetical protein SCDLUD_003670 [Saccharomycodes ludwigii]